MKYRGFNICIAGEAGQGIVTVGVMLGTALVRAGYALHCSQVYESRVRGGHNTFSVRLGPERAPTDIINMLVALNDEEVGLHRDNMAPDGWILSDDTVPESGERHLRVPFDEMGKGARANTIMAGVIAGMIGLELSSMRRVLEESLGDLKESVLEDNREVLAKAHAWGTSHKQRLPKLPDPSSQPDTNLMMNGNEVLAFGAMAAGLKFCSFYPMSPSTPVPLTIAESALKMGIVIEQAEDEIAAINMAIGASYAGARSMVATSGGGMALMCEGISLAGMVEVPIVVILAMRPGPATGLPARTEQADLNLALYAGHGEFPRAIFAPGTLQECFDLSLHAFDIAERFQGPVFILTDQYLADSYRNIPPFRLQDSFLKPLACPGDKDDDPDYERYAVTEDGISPRRIPGMGTTLAIADSDEHTPDGHITENLAVRVVMQDKRMAKLSGLRQATLAPTFSGGEQNKEDLLLICWGSTLGAVEEAASLLREKGASVGVCHFSQVYPLQPEQFVPRFQQAGRTVMVESNYTGQLAALIRTETGFSVDQRILRYDGLAMTAAYILEHLDKTGV